MAMDIQIYSNLPVEDTVLLIADVVAELKTIYGSRFWFSEIKKSSDLSKEILSEDFKFDVECDFMVSDITKEFDGLDVVARSIRKALGEVSSMVIYADTGKLFPETDYT